MTLKRSTAMLKVRQPGFFTTVQDCGRFGYRHLGVPVSGTSDQVAAGRVNTLLENPADSAVLEIAMQGPVLEFSQPAYIAWSGADMEVALDDSPLLPDQVHAIPAGSILVCGRITHGFRAYLGIRGGVLSPMVLGSRSYCAPITTCRQLKAHQELAYKPCEDYQPRLLKLTPSSLWKESDLVAHPGPEYDLLSQSHREQLFGHTFTLAKEHDRMACQLQEVLPPHQIRMITSATLPGTVQLTPAGRLIILMRDGQTTGGYPRILQLDERSTSVLAQKQFRDPVRFMGRPT